MNNVMLFEPYNLSLPKLFETLGKKHMRIIRQINDFLDDVHVPKSNASKITKQNQRLHHQNINWHLSLALRQIFSHVLIFKM
jgi:hypothetical protein